MKVNQNDKLATISAIPQYNCWEQSPWVPYNMMILSMTMMHIVHVKKQVGQNQWNLERKRDREAHKIQTMY